MMQNKTVLKLLKRIHKKNKKKMYNKDGSLKDKYRAQIQHNIYIIQETEGVEINWPPGSSRKINDSDIKTMSDEDLVTLFEKILDYFEEEVTK